MGNASLVDMTLPDGAILGTEEGVMLSYLCDFQHHMYGETMIVSVCGEDGEWTNLDAKCEHGKRCIAIPCTFKVKASLTFKCMTEHLFADFSYSIALDTYL